jgi:hypothetical protein
MIIHGIKIKPGMVLSGTRKDVHIILIAIPYGANTIAFVNITEGGLSLYYTTFLSNVKEIRDHPKNSDLMGGEILWKKQEEVTISLKEIANKFGIPKDVKIIIKD